VERQLVKTCADSTTWNWELFNRDLEEEYFGAFPVPKYDLAGAYRYGGGGNFKELYEKKLPYVYFFAGQKDIY
jgi:hypothetical protein